MKSEVDGIDFSFSLSVLKVGGNFIYLDAGSIL